MNELMYSLLTEIYGRLEAEALKTFLTSEEIDVELIQEGIGEYAYPTTVGELGKVQVFVPNEKLELAQTLLDAFQNGELDVEIAETDEFDDGFDDEPEENE